MSDDNTEIVYPSDGDTLLASVMTDNINALINRINNMGASVTADLEQEIKGIETDLQTALTKANNSAQLNGNNTFTGTNNFTGTIKVPNSTTTGTALSLRYYSIDTSGGDYESNCIQVGKLIVQWGRTTTAVSKNQEKTINFKKGFSTNLSYAVAFSYFPSGMVTTGNGIKTKNTNSCVISCYADASGSWGPHLTWIAIGV